MAAPAGAGAGAAAGGAILVYFTGIDRKVYILTGKEGRYLTDKYPADVSRIEAFQTSDKRTKEEAKSFFSGKAKEFEGQYRIRVNFSQLTGEPGKFHTKYVYLPDKESKDFKYGIPKGRVEPGESGLDAAKREFQEEVGVRMGSSMEIEFLTKTRFDNYYIYRHEVPPTLIDDFNTKLMDTQKIRGNYGEMFHVQMRSLDIIIANFDKFNSKSKDALRAQFPRIFPAAGGKRKTRRTKRNRKNRSIRRARRA